MNNWLKTYYGKYYTLLNPVIVEEGTKWALVRLTANKPVKGYSGTGYVLVNKNGRHSVTQSFSLQEGPATEENMATMKKFLHDRDQE